MTSSAGRWSTVAWAAAIAACTPRAANRTEGSFGVLWGGQVQSRGTIPLELDRSRQRVGFRLDFAAPLAAESTIEWELEMPATRLRPAPTGRITRLGEARVPAGRRRMEQETPFEPGDAPGAWRVRVKAGGEIIVDRGFEVVAPGAASPAPSR